MLICIFRLMMLNLRCIHMDLQEARGSKTFLAYQWLVSAVLCDTICYYLMVEIIVGKKHMIQWWSLGEASEALAWGPPFFRIGVGPPLSNSRVI